MGRSNRQARVSAWCNFSTVNGVDRRVEREREREQQTKLAQGEKNCMLMGWCLSKRSLKLVDIFVVRGKKLQIIHVGPVQAYGNVTFLPQSCTRLDTLANARACEKALPLPSSSNPCNGYSRPREREREREAAIVAICYASK